MKIVLFIYISLIVNYSGSLSLWGQSSSLSEHENAVALNFARALQRDDVFMGIYENPDRQGPTVLSSGEILEVIPGYSKTLLQHSLLRLISVQNLNGESNSYVFISQLPERVENQPYRPFIAIHGSKWILALQKVTNDLNGIEKDEPKSGPINISHNMARPFNDGLGAACLKWPKDKGLPQPKHLINVSESAVDDLKELRKFYREQRTRNAWSEADMNLTQKSLKSDFGRSVLNELSKSWTNTRSSEESR